MNSMALPSSSSEEQGWGRLLYAWVRNGQGGVQPSRVLGDVYPLPGSGGAFPRALSLPLPFVQSRF